MQEKDHLIVDVSQRVGKAIGKTNYDISIHFSKNSHEVISIFIGILALLMSFGSLIVAFLAFLYLFHSMRIFSK